MEGVWTGSRLSRIAIYASCLALLIAAVATATRPGQAESKKHQKSHSKAQKRPNIVLIMDDDQSAEQQRFLAKTNAALGDKGVTFTNSFVSYSLCCPSRSTLLTGQYAHNNGVRGNSAPSGGYSKLAPTLGNSLPVWLQNAGYYTGHIGKFLNGYGKTSPDTEVPPGWSEWHGSLDDPDAYPGGTYTQYGYTLNENGAIVHYGTTPDVVDPATNQTDVYSAKAAEFIRQRAPSRQPFYLSVAPNAPHAEAAVCNCVGDNPRAPPRYQGALGGESPPITANFNEADVSDKPSNIQALPLLNPTQVNGVYQRYRARSESLLGVDDMVQNVVSTLKATGELNNTVIIFTSDNGFFHGEHRVPQGKVRLYEPSIRVPLLMRGPGIPQGVKRGDTVENVDLAPTILDFAKAKAHRVEDGHSLVPVIKDKLLRLGRAILLETFFNADTDDEPDAPPLNYQALRTDRYLFAKYGTGDQELYDLKTDPLQLQSRSYDPSLAGVKARLDSLLGRLANCAGQVCRSRPPGKLDIRRQGSRCVARVVGRGSAPQDATFYVRGKRRGRDASAPLHHAVAGPPGSKVEAIVTVLDGRRVTLTRRLPGGC